MSEVEFKFGIPQDALTAVESALRRVGAHSRSIESHYWDSADRRLAKAGLSLRLRKSAGVWEQTVKGPGTSPVERLEETVARPGRWDAGGPTPELWMFAGTRAGKAVDAALARRRGRLPPLVRVHVSLVGRLAARIEPSGADIEIALDRGTIVAGERTLPLCELEAELKHGDDAALFDFAHASVDAHGVWLSTTAKAARGNRLAADAGEPRGVKARPPRLRHRRNGEDVFRAVMQSCLDQVLANASLVADGDVDEDVVHQLRIGLRRMRTAWRELAAWRGSLAAGWEAPSADVFRALGEYRDRKTVAVSMQQRLAAAGSPDPVLQPAGSQAVDPAALVRGPAFQHAMLDVLAFAVEARRAAEVSKAASPDHARNDVERTTGARLDKLHARLKRDARRFEDLDEPARHGVRRRLKRLRYLAELVAPLYRGGRVARFLGDLEPAQDELGHYMDLIVATRLASDKTAAGEGRAWFNVGWLRAQSPRAVERCRKALERVAAASPFWR